MLEATPSIGQPKSKHECGIPIEYAGTTYGTVEIDGKCFFTEDLRTESYRNGDAIMQSTTLQSYTDAISNGIGAFNLPAGRDWSSCSGCISSETDELLENGYGFHYNKYALTDKRELCPSGWHAMEISDWFTLTEKVGESFSDMMSTGERFGDSYKLKSNNNSHWSFGPGNNETELALIGSGVLSAHTDWNYGNVMTLWMPSEDESIEDVIRWARLSNLNNRVQWEQWDEGHSRSVRCVQDDEDIYGAYHSTDNVETFESPVAGEYNANHFVANPISIVPRAG